MTVLILSDLQYIANSEPVGKIYFYILVLVVYIRILVPSWNFHCSELW